MTVDSIGDAVICPDDQDKIILLNLVAERLTGWSQVEANDHPMDEVFRIVDSVTRKNISNPTDVAVKQKRIGHLPPNCLLIRRDGERSPRLQSSQRHCTLAFRNIVRARSPLCCSSRSSGSASVLT